MRRKRKGCADGGDISSLATASADPYLLIAQEGTKMVGDYADAFSYKPQLGAEKTDASYAKDIIMKGIQGGLINAIPSIIRMNKDKRTMVSGSPGAYQQGGPITGYTRKKPTPYYQSGYFAPTPQPVDVTNLFNPFVTAATNIPTTNVNTYYNTLEANGGSAGAGKSKSKNRFREKADGGPITPKYQALGNIEFDPSKAKKVQDYLVVTDRKTGKDYGVKQNADGTYKFYNKKLTFLGRSLAEDPSKWTGTKSDQGIVDPMNVLNVRKNRVASSAATPYMDMGDNLFYNPYDRVLNYRNNDGTYSEVPESATHSQWKEGQKSIGVTENIKEVNPLLDRKYLPNSRDIAAHLDQFPQSKATGGKIDEDSNPNDADDQLSNQSFQVKGAPNVTDGNSYNINGNPVKLDHNEVVDTKANFVFSTKLKDPKSNKPFSEIAKGLYSTIGKAEKTLTNAPKDDYAMNTIKYTKSQISALANTQEALASTMGLRNSSAPAFAGGGPLPWEGFDVADFQNWYNSLPGGEKLAVDKKWGPATEKAYKNSAYDYMKLKGKNTAISGGVEDLVLPGGDKYTEITPVGGKILPSSIGEPQTLFPKLSTTPLPSKSFYSLKQTVPAAEGNMFTEPGQAAYEAILNTPKPAPNLPSAAKVPLADILAGLKKDDSSSAQPRYTAGDIMQGIEVGSKFFQTLTGPEKEKQLLNNTPISRVSYDVNPALQQNQASYRSAVNSIDTNSANTRRVIANSLFSKKLNADNQTITNYQNMNNQATVDYQNRLSGQRQQNIASAFRTNEINAANRGAYDQVVQNAFTSVGNLGEALNNRQLSYDALRILKARYPQVYESMMADMYGTKKTS